MSWPQWFLAALMISVCGFLMLVVLLQRGRGGGLAGAFGGGGGSSAFGAKTGDILTWITVGIAGIFLVLAVTLNFVFDQTPATAATAPVAAIDIEIPEAGLSIDPATLLPVDGESGLLNLGALLDEGSLSVPIEIPAAKLPVDSSEGTSPTPAEGDQSETEGSDAAADPPTKQADPPGSDSGN